MIGVARRLAVAVLVLAVLACSGGPSDQPPAPSPMVTPTPDANERAAQAISLDRWVGAVMRLALEYEIELEESAVRELFVDIFESKRIKVLDQFRIIWIEGLLMDEGDYANELKESLLDDGISPRRWVQELADALSRRP